MDPAAAIVLGAGIALASQLVAHHLSVKRDRRNQKRQRLTEAVVAAAAALYTEPDGRMSDEEREAILRDMRPDSVMALDPETHLDLLPFHNSTYRGITLLQLHLGHDHPLLDEYVEVAGTCATPYSQPRRRK